MRAAQPQIARQPSERRRAFVRRKVVPWLFVLPILLINLAVVAGPASSAVYYSMTDWNGIGAAHWVGLENFQHPVRRSGVPARVPEQRHLVGDVPDGADRDGAGRGQPAGADSRGAIFFRMTLFIPYVLPSVITAALWRGLLVRTGGYPRC